MTFRQTPGLFFRGIASTLLASLLVVLALAANPHWHELAHAEPGQCEHEHEHGEDRHHHEHSCVVDLFVAGAVDHTEPIALALTPPLDGAVKPFIATTEFVASVFLSGSILEHAPPAFA